MSCLLDTHAFLWWIGPHERLSAKAHQAVSDGGDVYVSAVAIWELAIKSRIGRLTIADDFRSRITAELEANDFQVLPVELEHALAVHDLPDHPGRTRILSIGCSRRRRSWRRFPSSAETASSTTMA